MVKKKKKKRNSPRKRCFRCGLLFNKKDMVFAADDYQADVRNDDTKVWQCLECHATSGDDI